MAVSFWTVTGAINIGVGPPPLTVAGRGSAGDRKKLFKVAWLIVLLAPGLGRRTWMLLWRGVMEKELIMDFAFDPDAALFSAFMASLVRAFGLGAATVVEDVSLEFFDAPLPLGAEDFLVVGLVFSEPFWAAFLPLGFGGWYSLNSLMVVLAAGLVKKENCCASRACITGCDAFAGVLSFAISTAWIPKADWRRFAADGLSMRH